MKKYTERGYSKIVTTARANCKKMRQDSLNAYYKDPLYCTQCKEVIKPGEGKGAVSSARKKRFCSRKCFHAARIIKSGRTIYRGACKNCKKEKKNRYAQFCSRACQGSYSSSQIIDEWLLGGVGGSGACISVPIRNWLIQQAGGRCSKCGWKEIHPNTKKVPLTINHIDGNAENHSKTNLEVLCPNCHSLTPTYGSLNKGNGSPLRYRSNYKKVMPKKIQIPK